VPDAIANAELGRKTNCSGGGYGTGIGAGYSHHVHHFQVYSKGALHAKRLRAEVALVGLLVLYTKQQTFEHYIISVQCYNNM